MAVGCWWLTTTIAPACAYVYVCIWRFLVPCSALSCQVAVNTRKLRSRSCQTQPEVGGISGGGFEIRYTKNGGLRKVCAVGLAPAPHNAPQWPPRVPRGPTCTWRAHKPTQPWPRPRFPAACGWPVEAVKAGCGVFTLNSLFVSGHRPASRHAPESPNLPY